MTERNKFGNNRTKKMHLGEGGSFGGYCDPRTNMDSTIKDRSSLAHTDPGTEPFPDQPHSEVRSEQCGVCVSQR